MDNTNTIENELKQRETGKISYLFDNKTSFFREINDKKIVLFLDFDGTLSEIVNNPEDAVISKEMKEILEKCAKKYKTAVVSGRDMDDVKSRVNIDDLIYAGSHGFRISGPKGLKMKHPESADIIPNLDDIEKELNQLLGNEIEGIKIERKMFAIAVHYRNALEEYVPYIEEKVNKVTANNPELKKGKGKKIFEIKPDLNWHKGKAILWIMDSIGIKDKDKVIPIYLGDDVTDEDGFKAIYENGIGILVGSHGKPSAARYRLENVDEVKEFLQLIT